MNSQSLSRLLQGTYQGLGSQDGIVDLRPPVLSSRDEFKSEPAHEPFLIHVPRSNGRRAPEYTSSNLGDRTYFTVHNHVLRLRHTWCISYPAERCSDVLE